MNIKIFTITLINIVLVFLLFGISFSQVNQEWVTRYNGPLDSSDYFFALTIDNSGNVYVTGNSYGNGTGIDYLTIKYNPAGIKQWEQRYNGQANTFDAVSSIAVDISGNVYVTGGSSVNSPIPDYATVKYNSAGVRQWVAPYSGPANTYDHASSIAADESGNVYVTGYRFGTGTSSDIATIKYNSEGVQLWVARYNGPGNSTDIANSLVMDGLGNVYVTGYCTISGTDYDFVTIKYNSAGVQQWASTYNGPVNASDIANSIALDPSGNVYVTGYSAGGLTYNDYATVKYNSNGIQQWAARNNGSGNGFDEATTIAVDDSGHVYVTGYISDSLTAHNYSTLKYSNGGVLLWTAIYSGQADYNDNEAYSMSLDDSGNVYVTGGSGDISSNNKDYVTIKYNSEGDSQWVARYNGPANSYDVSNSIAVDGSGNVYVGGSSQGIGTGTDYATIKYSLSTGIRQISSSIPEYFSLSQNYPNPFNPVTNLEFGISDLGFTSLKVYDILGKEVANLVNEKLSPGNYKVEFDGSNLTSGVYFYRLTADGFTDTKKMMILK